jgi:DNA polymerase-3 subunit delta'
MPWSEVECHPRVRKALQRSIEKGMLQTTHLLYGPEGAGQNALARAVAMTLSCQNQTGDFCGMCKNCCRIQARAYPDVFELYPWEDWSDPKRKGRDFGIDHMREVQKVAAVQPYEGEYKVFIVHHAHRMTEEAANCLLKTLEEPNQFSLFLLLTENVNAILPTILSRCRRIRLMPLPLEELVERLGEELEPEQAQTIALAAHGLPERARELLQEGFLEERDYVLDVLRQVRTSLSAPMEVVDPLVKDKDKITGRLVILQELLRDALLAVELNEPVTYYNPDKKEEIARLWKGVKPELLIQGIENIWSILDSMELNVNPTLLFSDLLIGLSMAGRRDVKR